MATVEQVRAKLPNVSVEWNGKRYVGHVRGRKNSYATVSFGGTSGEWSWEAVTRAYNNKSSLKY